MTSAYDEWFYQTYTLPEAQRKARYRMTPEELIAINHEHFLPETADWGDLRKGLLQFVHVPVAKKVNEGRQGWVQVDWIHYNVDGPLTKDAFEVQVANAIGNLAQQINDHGRLEPFKIREEGKRGIGFESYDFKHRDIDLRAICMVGQYQLPKHIIEQYPDLQSFPCPGLKFIISTLVQHDPEADEEDESEDA